MKRRGLTLIEMMVSLVMVGILSVALFRAYSFGINFPARAEQSRGIHRERQNFEDRIKELLQGATLTENWTDQTYYFLAGIDASGEADRISFTAASQKVPEYVVQSQDDFETLNGRYGTQGGTAEISIGTTPVGDGGAQRGLYIRTQRPADGDPDQGGTEEALEVPLQSISFEFYDGATWLTEWNTLDGVARLPAAVRVTYQFEEDQDTKSFVVRLPNSDVTADNPFDPNATQAGGAQ